MFNKKINPIVWTIAGSDSGGGAGIQADLHTFHDLGVHGCTVTTALTSQNSIGVRHIAWTSAESLQTQIAALEDDLYPAAIKLGMLGSIEVMQTVLPFLKRFTGPIIIDPVMVASSGANLFRNEAQEFFIKHIIPCATLLTPNLSEAQVLSKQTSLQTDEEIKIAANYLLNCGAKSVLIKGGHTQGNYCQDYFTDGKQGFYLTIEKRDHANNHGSGCTLSAAITAALALGFTLSDSLVIAKSYVSQGLRLAQQIGQGSGPVAHVGWPENIVDLPWITNTAYEGIHRSDFLPCKDLLGFYPLVDSAEWIEKILPWGIKTLQLRIKNKMGTELEQEIVRSIQVAKKYDAQLFINDYWELAIKHGAYGVHLGQDDLVGADCAAIAKAGLRLGLSSHCFTDVARAHALRPSYMASGPIFHTNSKQIDFAPLGVQQLAYWRKLLDYPLVAIGGIDRNNLATVLDTGVDGVSVISALTKAEEPERVAKEWMSLFINEK